MRYLLILFILTGCIQNPYEIKWDAVQERQPIIQGIKTPTFETIKKVKAEVDSYEYKNDINNFGISDYWATPDEVKLKKAGDCEDFAIYEYYALRKEGFTKKDLTIWIANEAVWPYRPHAILTVEFNNVKYVLDNEIPKPMPLESVKNRYQLVHGLD